MNNTEPWKKYVPETVSLYHVDYRENLDEREDLQEQCIRNNNMGRLYETVMECYAAVSYTHLTLPTICSV